METSLLGREISTAKQKLCSEARQTVPVQSDLPENNLLHQPFHGGNTWGGGGVCQLAGYIPSPAFSPSGQVAVRVN